MWIRSQDKTELIDTKRIQVNNKSLYAFENNGNEESWIKIGDYNSKERALEILDDIELEITSYNPDNNVYIMMEE